MVILAVHSLVETALVGSFGNKGSQEMRNSVLGITKRKVESK